MQNGQFGSNIFFSKGKPKMNLQELFSESAQKTPGKKTAIIRKMRPFRKSTILLSL